MVACGIHARIISRDEKKKKEGFLARRIGKSSADAADGGLGMTVLRDFTLMSRLKPRPTKAEMGRSAPDRYKKPQVSRPNSSGHLSYKNLVTKSQTFARNKKKEGFLARRTGNSAADAADGGLGMTHLR